MQDVGRDADEYVGIREVGPEGRENRPKALSDEFQGVLASGLSVKCLFGLLLVAECKLVVCSSLVCTHEALWTAILSAAGHETLLGVVSNVGCENWKDSSNAPISTHHLHTILSRSHERLKEQLHAVMKKSVACNGVVLERGEL